ncbi:MAG: hypothetical protein ACRDT0_20165 [Pseudonocardiaceae bacterium]
MNFEEFDTCFDRFERSTFRLETPTRRTLSPKSRADGCSSTYLSSPSCGDRDRPRRWHRAIGGLRGPFRGVPGPQHRPARHWAEIEAAYERIQRTDPDGWQDYLGELAQTSAGEPDATAAEEWPEYNA